MALLKVPHTVLGLTWREHIGGRWAVSLLGFAITAPLAFVAVFANIQDTSNVNVRAWAVSSGISLAFLALLWWLASVTVLRNRCERPVPIWVVVLIGALSGGARSSVATYLTIATGAFDPPGSLTTLFVVRFLIGAAQGAVGLPALALALSISARYRSERARLLAQQTTLREQQAREVGAAQALRDALAGPVQQRLRDLADRLGTQESAEVSALAQDVREQAHELWSQAREPVSEPRVRLRDVLVISVRKRPLPLVVIWLLWFPVSVLSVAGRNTLPMAVALSIVGAVVLTVIYRIGARLTAARPGLGWLALSLGTLGGAFVAGVVMWQLSGGRNLAGNAPLIVASMVWLLGSTLIVSVIESAVVRSQEVLEELQSRISDEEVELWDQERMRASLAYDVASVLHGVVQGRLVAAQTTDESQALARRALQEGIDRIDSVGSVAPADIDELIRELSAPWSALMRIDVVTTGGIVPANRVRDLSDVVEECFSNAFRHGESSQVSIEALENAGVWELRIRSNGRGMERESIPGMGSSLFDAVSCGQWTRTPIEGGGCEVFLRMPSDSNLRGVFPPA